MYPTPMARIRQKKTAFKLIITFLQVIIDHTSTIGQERENTNISTTMVKRMAGEPSQLPLS
jgi:hypothetical protein